MHDPYPRDDLLAAIDRVAAVRLDPSTFPQDPPVEFRAAAVELLDQIARIRFMADGGDPAELDALALSVEDPTFVVDLRDLREFVAGFHAEGDQARYSACAAGFDWVTTREA